MLCRKGESSNKHQINMKKSIEKLQVITLKKSNLNGLATRFTHKRLASFSDFDSTEGQDFVPEEKLVFMMTAVELEAKTNWVSRYENLIDNPNHEVLGVYAQDKEKLLKPFKLQDVADVLEKLLSIEGFLFSSEDLQKGDENAIVISKENAIITCNIHRLQTVQKLFKNYKEKLQDGEMLCEKADADLDVVCEEARLPRRVKGRNSTSRLVDQLIQNIDE